MNKHLIVQTEGAQVGLEWGQLPIQRVLKKFESQTGEKL
ncbi:hypothetical protein D1BOALGB6SA_3638 [Olavius sp. associated proteobacterium Delta 1]|nr:hypothetical protein D1BOALGB6SA_3638 [Olavius sp. associated proteobacterium Delta 1]